jgi:hypothetical protein
VVALDIWLLDRRCGGETVVTLDFGPAGFSVGSSVGSGPDCQLVLCAPEVAPVQALLIGVGHHRFVEALAPGVTWQGHQAATGQGPVRVDWEVFEIGPFLLAFHSPDRQRSAPSGTGALLPGPSTFLLTDKGPMETPQGRAERENRERLEAERQARLERAARAPLKYDPLRERLRRVEAGAPCPECCSQTLFECWCVCGQPIWAVCHSGGCTKSDGVTTSLASCPRCGADLSEGG